MSDLNKLLGPSRMAEKISLRLAALAINVDCIGDEISTSPESSMFTLESVASSIGDIERDTRELADAMKRIADRLNALLKRGRFANDLDG